MSDGTGVPRAAEALSRAEGDGAVVGIVAGDGLLPVEVLNRARRHGSVAVVHVGLHADPRLKAQAAAFACVPVNEWGRALRFLRDAGARTVYFAGKVDKRLLFSLTPDATAEGRLRSLRERGDDALLAAVAAALEAEGLRVGSQAELLADLFVEEGLLTPHPPRRWDDVVLGVRVAKVLGRLDVGQTVVVKDGVVVAVEALEGTDAAIRRAGELCGPGATVVKVVKPSQDRRFDIPTVGLQTMDALIAAGAQTLALEAGAVLLLERDVLLARAAAAGMAVVGVRTAGDEASDVGLEVGR